MKILILAIILALVFPGCFQQIAVDSLGQIMDTGFEVLNEEQDLEIAKISIASNLTLIETLLKRDSNNTHYLLLASIGYSSYAVGFVEDDSIERARLLYLRGKDYGLEILTRNHDFSNALSRGIEEFRLSLTSFTEEDIPAIFWTAISWGSYIRLSLTEPEALADLPKVEALMQYVLEKDSTFFYGGAHFFLGTLYGSRPKILGGDPEASRRHFEECLEINGGKFLMTYVYYARSYAVQTQNKELFESCLTKVDSTSLDVLPQARLTNAIAKQKAKLLRAKIDELF